MKRNRPLIIKTDSERIDWILNHCEIRWLAGRVNLRDRVRIDAAIFIKDYLGPTGILNLAALGSSVKPSTTRDPNKKDFS